MLETVSQRALLAAGAACTAFLAYCVYFDHKRRSAPGFREKLLEKRRKKREAEQKADEDEAMIDFSNLQNAAEMQAVFTKELGKGEELLEAGDVAKAAKHLANAVLLSGNPNQIMYLFAQQMSQAVVQLIAAERLMTAMMASRNPTEAEVYGNAPVEPAPAEPAPVDTDELE